ncbi:HNH endonuclease [Acinetobacter variabilis]|uniref:HNH endonuclease n=1 Tax=Acinetobacter variabilis TaxID=70346 RepID=UPI0035D4121A
MIKLRRGERPKYLADDKVDNLTQRYIDSGKSVWNNKQIKQPLMESSSNKCAYCESDLSKPGAYMEVEHFLPKSKHPSLVVKWENLLPSCKRCNGLKSDYDVSLNPIINPYDKDPTKELTFDTFCIFGSTELGNTTVNLLDLNGEDLLGKRSFVGTVFRKELIKLSHQCSLIKKLTLEDRNMVRSILLAAQSNRPYSATVATLMHISSEYKTLRQKLIDSSLWGEDMEDLHQKSLLHVLPLR